jgi:V-type H+-transporting ATPase subunit E
MAAMDNQAAKQTDSMVNFILSEAKHKAEEINALSTQAFAVEKEKLLSEMKKKIRREYDAKAKKVDSQRAISRSRVVNESRLAKVAERAKYLDQVEGDVREKLLKVTQESRGYGQLLTDLIVQGAITLLEPEIKVRCRQADMTIAKGVLKQAEGEFAKAVFQQTKVAKTVSFSLDTEKFLPPPPGPGVNKSCIGGVVLACHDGLITVDNTLDPRLRLIIEQDKPQIRAQLFPER